jgi:spore maturation protein B
MSALLFLSNGIIPIIVFGIVGYAMLQKVPVFDKFVEGVMDGFQTVYKVLPTLIGLLVAVGMLRNSGFMEALGRLLQPVAGVVNFPSQLVPLIIVKLFSSSAATSLLLDIYKQFGTDSQIGVLASVLMSCSETVFYTMSVYFVTAGVKKTRWTLAGALTATFVGIIAGTLLVM